MADSHENHGHSDKDGHFRRKTSTFRNFVSADPGSQFPAEKDRYALYLHRGCPWAHRANIARSLKGLEEVIQLILWDKSAIHEGKGWAMSGALNFKEESLYGFTNSRQLYEKADPGYKGRYPVPILWDKKEETIVSNESGDIIRMFYCEFDAFIPVHMRESSKAEKAIFPKHMREEIEDMNEWVYSDLNNGVYKTGFATTQEAYEENANAVFIALDRLETHLGEPGHGPYLFGDYITDADIRLFTTLIRFDVSYFTILRCNLKMIRYEYPRLHKWLRELYWDETERTNGGAFKNTVNFPDYKEGLVSAIKGKIVPIGPKPDILPL